MNTSPPPPLPRNPLFPHYSAVSGIFPSASLSPQFLILFFYQTLRTFPALSALSVRRHHETVSEAPAQWLAHPTDDRETNTLKTKYCRRH
jgi:hypothetical protein